jgi:biotin transport system substrate-specific component
MSKLLFVLLFTSLTAFSAFVAIKVPFLAWGMPKSLPGAESLYQMKGLLFGSHIISAQLLMVWLTGALLGARRGGLAMALYLALGLGGLPIFTNGGGFGYVSQPTFGYLAAFLPAVIVTGIYACDHRFGHTWRGMFYGLAMVQGCGLVYELAVRGQFFRPASWWDLGWGQVLQFLPGQLALMTVVAAVIAAARKLDAAYLAWSSQKREEDQEPLLPAA